MDSRLLAPTLYRGASMPEIPPLQTKLARLCLIIGAAGALAPSAGCLSDSYRIPDQDLQRLTSLPPEQRGQAIRVVQRTSFSPEVAADMPQPLPAPERPPVVVFVGASIGGPIGPPVHHFAGPPPPVVGPVVRGTPGGALAGPRAPVPRGGLGPSMPSKVSGDKDAVVLLAAAAVGVTIGSVVTEGARFDGVAAANPAQPLHLLYDNGEHRVTTLWELQPPDLANLDEAVISQKEGPIVRGERAPLDRTGFTWRFEGGLMGTTLPTGETASGAGVNMGLGYFPLHWLGFLLHCQFGGATLDGRDVLDTRLGLEANAFPLAVGRLHIGGYGQIGHAWLEADAPDGSGAALTRDAWSAGAGGLLELALTTRLAIVGRLGETFDAAIDGRTPHNLVGMLGFSVY